MPDVACQLGYGQHTGIPRREAAPDRFFFSTGYINSAFCCCCLLFLHFCIAFRRLPITDSSNKEHPVGGYGHKSTHSNCPTRSDRRSSLGIGRFVTWKLLLVLVAHLLLVLLPTWHPPSFEPLPVRSNLRPTIQRARHHAARVQPHGGLKWK